VKWSEGKDKREETSEEEKSAIRESEACVGVDCRVTEVRRASEEKKRIWGNEMFTASSVQYILGSNQWTTHRLLSHVIHDHNIIDTQQLDRYTSSQWWLLLAVQASKQCFRGGGDWTGTQTKN